MAALDDAIAEAMAQVTEAQSAEAPEAAEVEGQAEPEELEVTPEPEDTEGDADEAEPEDTEDEESDGEVDEEEDDSEDTDTDDEPDDGPVTIADDAVVVIDGEEVTGAELKASRLRQADYTRKTQEVAAERREVETLREQMVSWYEERAGNPSAWINEIAGETDNPARTIAEALGAEGNPTQAVAWVLTTLAEQGKLDQQFVDKFGLHDVAAKAGDYQTSAELAAIKRQLQQEREAREAAEQTSAESAKTQAILADYEKQWSSIVADEGLEFADEQAAFDSRLEVMRFAREHEIPNLEHAYAAMQRANRGKAAEPKSKPKAQAKEVVARKRAARAVSPKAPPAGPAPRKSGDYESALVEASRELGFDLS